MSPDELAVQLPESRQLPLPHLARESCEEVEVAALGVEVAEDERPVHVQPDQVVSQLSEQAGTKLVEQRFDRGAHLRGTHARQSSPNDYDRRQATREVAGWQP